MGGLALRLGGQIADRQRHREKEHEGQQVAWIGQLDPDTIHTPGIYVHRVVKGEKYEKRIERRTTRKN